MLLMMVVMRYNLRSPHVEKSNDGVANNLPNEEYASSPKNPKLELVFKAKNSCTATFLEQGDAVGEVGQTRSYMG